MVKVTKKQLEKEIQDLRSELNTTQEENQRLSAQGSERSRQGAGREQSCVERDDREEGRSRRASSRSSNRSHERDEVNISTLRLVSELIPKFEGGSESNLLFEFIDVVETTMEDWNIDEETMVPLLKSKLSGSAGVWWRCFKQTHSNQVTWDQLKSGLMNEFVSREYQHQLRRKLQEMKMKNSVRVFVDNFRRITQQLPKEESDSQFVFMFVQGLSENIRNLVRAFPDNLRSLESVMQAALVFDDIYEGESGIAQAAAAGRSKGRLTCTKCGRYGHMVDKCWDIVGKPANLKKNEARRTIGVENLVEPCEINDPILSDVVSMYTAECKSTTKVTMNNNEQKSETITLCLDSACTDHMVKELRLIQNLIECNIDVKMAVGNVVKCRQRGNLQVSLMTEENDVVNWNIGKALWVPELEESLISMSSLLDDDYKIEVKRDEIVIRKDTFQMKCTREGKLFKFKVNCYDSFAAKVMGDESELWHKRLLHPGQTASSNISKLTKHDHIKEHKNCESCKYGKQVRKTHPTYLSQSKEVLGVVVCDLYGPFTYKGLNDGKYVLTFIDAYSRFNKIYVIPAKESKITLECLKEFIVWSERQTAKRLKVIRSDNGREFINEDWIQYSKVMGFELQSTIANHPESNGIAERFNRVLGERIRCIFCDSGLPFMMWSELAYAVSYVLNRIPRKSSPTQTPLNLFLNQPERKTKYKDLKVLGCKCFVRRNFLGPKFDGRSDVGFLVGYGRLQQGYRVWLPNKKSIETARDVEFEEVTMFKNCVEAKDYTSGNIPLLLTEYHEQPQVRARSTYQMPYNFQNQIVSLENNDLWIEAINNEYKSLMKHETFEICERPKNVKVLGSRWVLAVKYNKDTNECKHKARFVANGSHQDYGVHYLDTYAPTLGKEAMRIVLWYIVQYNLIALQYDVCTAFLHGELTEKIYIELPSVIFNEEFKREKVGCLNRSIYGLKQSPLVWNVTISKYFEQLNFKRSVKEPCIYHGEVNNERYVIALYVDDFIVGGPHKKGIEDIVKQIRKRFELSELGELHSLVGIRIERNDTEYTLDQTSYIETIYKKYAKLNLPVRSLPLSTSCKIEPTKENDKIYDNKQYRSLLGALMYIAVSTRPDISFSIGLLARHASNASVQHGQALENLLSYVYSTRTLKLRIRKGEHQLNIYTDADYGGQEDKSELGPTYPSVSGGVFMLGDSVIHWSSSKQKCTSMSSTESEAISAAKALKTTGWMYDLITELTKKQKISYQSIY